MAEYIEREAASRVLCDACGNAACPKGLIPRCSYYEKMQSIPAADVRPVVRAKWEDVHIDRPEIADIEVASMFCPNCNRWYNKVYHYGNPIEFVNFCSFCGADMRAVET